MKTFLSSCLAASLFFLAQSLTQNYSQQETIERLQVANDKTNKPCIFSKHSTTHQWDCIEHDTFIEVKL